MQNKIPMNILKGDIIITYYTAWSILVCVCQWLCTGPRGEVPRSYMTVAKCMKHYWLFSGNNYLLRIKPLIHLSGIKIIDVVECHYLWNDLEWMKQREFLSMDFADILPILVTSCILQKLFYIIQCNVHSNIAINYASIGVFLNFLSNHWNTLGIGLYPQQKALLTKNQLFNLIKS